MCIKLSELDIVLRHGYEIIIYDSWFRNYGEKGLVRQLVGGWFHNFGVIPQAKACDGRRRDNVAFESQ